MGGWVGERAGTGLLRKVPLPRAICAAIALARQPAVRYPHGAETGVETWVSG